MHLMPLLFGVKKAKAFPLKFRCKTEGECKWGCSDASFLLQKWTSKQMPGSQKAEKCIDIWGDSINTRWQMDL